MAQSSIAERFSVDISWIFKTDSTEINSSDLMIGDILKYNQYYYAICTPNRIYRTLDYLGVLSISEHIMRKFPMMRSFINTWPSFDTLFIFSLIDFTITYKTRQILDSLKNFINSSSPHFNFFKNLCSIKIIIQQ